MPCIANVVNTFNLFFFFFLEFSPKRLLSRGSVLLVILGMAELFPRFGPLLNLAGCSVNVFICFLFPIWFYHKLYSYSKKSELILPVVVVVLAILAGVTSTFTNLVDVIKTFGEIYSTTANSNATFS